MVPLAIPLFHCAKSLTTFVFYNFSISHEEVLTTTPLVAEIFEEG
jgi:hypothetical protein